MATKFIHNLGLILGLTLLFACTSEAPFDPARDDLYLNNAAFYEGVVFENDTRDIHNALVRSSTRNIHTNLLSIGRSSPDHLFEDMVGFYEEKSSERDGSDIFLTFITTHGTPGMVVIGGEEEVAGVDANNLNALFAPVNSAPHIIVLQACYSGSLIETLKQPNRIIITAAAKDRPSFGCKPDNRNTWFTKSLKAEMERGGSLRDIVARTKAAISENEMAEGIPQDYASNPQHFVGRNIREIWNRPL